MLPWTRVAMERQYGLMWRSFANGSGSALNTLCCTLPHDHNHFVEVARLFKDLRLPHHYELSQVEVPTPPGAQVTPQGIRSHMFEAAFERRATQLNAFVSKSLPGYKTKPLTHADQDVIMTQRVAAVVDAELKHKWPHCRPMRLWFVAADDVLNNICLNGFASLTSSAESECRFGGPGVYLFPQLSRALMEVERVGASRALLCCAVVASIYPITRAVEYAGSVGGKSSMYCDRGAPAVFMADYDAHFATVDRALDFEAARVENGKAVGDELFDEVVIRNGANILPWLRVTFCKSKR